MTVTRRRVCGTPSLYPAAPGVCNGCGNDLAKHQPVPRALAQPGREAQWQVMIAFGGPHDAMARGPSLASPRFRAHMATCQIDWSRTGMPGMFDLAVHDGDQGSGGSALMLAAQMGCVCGYYNVCVSVSGLSLGELLWHAEQAERPVA